MSQTSDLILHWRESGPVAWAQSPYGWIGEDGHPITLTPWQRAVLACWFEHKEVVTMLGISNVKKTGKTFLTAVLTCWRWLALPGLHFCAGNDLDQSAGRQFSEISAMVKRNPYLKQHVKATNKQLVFIPTGSTLEALPADYAGASGANFITSSHTECWAILYENGRRLWEELTSIPGTFHGLPCLRVCDSYAGYEGESETWHKLVDRGLSGQRLPGEWPLYLAGGLLLFHAEGESAQAQCFRGTPEQARAYYAEQRETLRPNTYIRLHENKRTSNESAFITPELWAACYSPDVQRWADGDTRRLILGADASTSRDLTALVCTTYNDALGRVEAVYCRVWKPQRGLFRGGKPTVDIDETLTAEVLRLHGLGVVASVTADPFQLHTSILKWEKAGIRVIEMPQTAARVEADQALYDAIIGRTLAHHNDPVLTEHINNAVAIETPRGFRLAKEKTARKIDAAVALSMSHYGAKCEGAYFVGSMPNPFYSDLPEGLEYYTLPGTGHHVVIERRYRDYVHPVGVNRFNCKVARPAIGTACPACACEWYELVGREDDELWRKVCAVYE